MIILPAIDIKDGKCVRLVRGDYATAHQVASDPFSTAESFALAGSRWMHMVDLDGAKDGKTVNKDLFLEMAKTSPLKIELGGGIRSLETAEQYLSAGIARVILGSAAVKNPEFVKNAVANFGDRIAVGIDAKNGKVAAEGWLDTTDVDYLDLARAMEQVGVHTIIFTDTSKDGTLSGPNLVQLAEIHQAVSCNIIASGGVSCLNDIDSLKNLGLYGAICGKSLYQGSLDLKQALSVAGEQERSGL